MRQRRVTEESFGDTAADINTQYSLCLAFLWARLRPCLRCRTRWRVKKYLLVRSAAVSQPLVKCRLPCNPRQIVIMKNWGMSQYWCIDFVHQSIQQSIMWAVNVAANHSYVHNLCMSHVRYWHFLDSVCLMSRSHCMLSYQQAKPVTTVQDCIWTLPSMKLLDIFDEAPCRFNIFKRDITGYFRGDLRAISLPCMQQQKPHIFDKLLEHLWQFLWPIINPI